MTNHGCDQADRCVLDPHCPHHTTCCRTTDPGDQDPTDTIRLKDVARLDLQPGDTLVVTLAGATKDEAAFARDHILATLAGRLTSDHLLVLPDTATIGTIRHDGEQPLAEWERELLAQQAADSTTAHRAPHRLHTVDREPTERGVTVHDPAGRRYLRMPEGWFGLDDGAFVTWDDLTRRGELKTVWQPRPRRPGT